MLDQIVSMERSDDGKDWSQEWQGTVREWFGANVADLWDERVMPDNDVTKLMYFIISDKETVTFEPSLAGFCRLRKVKGSFWHTAKYHQDNYLELAKNATTQRDKNLQKYTQKENRLCNDLIDEYAAMRDTTIIEALKTADTPIYGDLKSGICVIAYGRLTYAQDDEWVFEWMDINEFDHQVRFFSSDIKRIIPTVPNLFDIEIYGKPES